METDRHTETDREERERFWTKGTSVFIWTALKFLAEGILIKISIMCDKIDTDFFDSKELKNRN